MIRCFRAPFAFAMFLALGGATARADLVIDTVSSWDGSNFVSSFGEPGTATFGQTITTDAANTFLKSFTFHIVTNTVNMPANTARFAAYVMGWDAANFRATGPILFDSGLITHNPSDDIVPITINPNIQLQADAQYVLFFSASNYFDGLSDGLKFGALSTDGYAGGDFVYANSISDFGALTAAAWSTFSVPDLAFTAEFSPAAAAAVPEPGSAALAASGALGLAIVARGRRRR